MRLEELGQLKKSTSSGLDPVTFRLVALTIRSIKECPILNDQGPSVKQVSVPEGNLAAAMNITRTDKFFRHT
jgi:hypothetical protein